MSDLICPKCEKPIVPGDEVDMVFPEDEMPRIITDADDIIITHLTCPA